MLRCESVTFEKFRVLKFSGRRKFEFSGSKKAFNLIIDPDKTVYQIEVYVVSDTKLTSKKQCMTHYYDVALISGWLRWRLFRYTETLAVKNFHSRPPWIPKTDPESNPNPRFDMIRLLSNLSCNIIRAFWNYYRGIAVSGYDRKWTGSQFNIALTQWFWKPIEKWIKMNLKPFDNFHLRGLKLSVWKYGDIKLLSRWRYCLTI